MGTTTKVNKSAWITDLLAQGVPLEKICKVVSCNRSYVRAVRNRIRNQEKYGTTLYPNEKHVSRLHAERCRRDPEYHRRHLEYQRKWKANKRQTDPEFRERERASSRKAYYHRKQAQGGSAHGH